MSAEVLVHAYLWNNSQGNIKFGKRKRDEDQDASDIPFRHNYIHDGESLWRLYMYILLSAQPVDETEEITTKNKINRFQIFTRFFPNDDLLLQRSNAGTNPFHNLNFLKILNSSAIPDEYDDLIQLGITIRDELAEVYGNCQPSGTEFDPTPMKDVHRVIDEHLSRQVGNAKQLGRFKYEWNLQTLK